MVIFLEMASVHRLASVRVNIVSHSDLNPSGVAIIYQCPPTPKPSRYLLSSAQPFSGATKRDKSTERPALDPCEAGATRVYQRAGWVGARRIAHMSMR